MGVFAGFDNAALSQRVLCSALGSWLRSGSLHFVRRPPLLWRVRLSCPCIIGYGSSPSRCGPPYASELSTDGQTWDIPGSDAIHLRVMCLRPRRDGGASHNGVHMLPLMSEKGRQIPRQRLRDRLWPAATCLPHWLGQLWPSRPGNLLASRRSDLTLASSGSCHREGCAFH
jgi:hypothetical protein